MNFHLPYSNVFSAAPDFVMGLAFLATWIDPASIGEDMVSSLSQIMILEFIIIHSAGFMTSIIYGNAPKGKKIKILFGLGLFYSVFVLGFSFGFRSWWPLIAFGGLMFNRMLSVLTGQAEQGKENEFIMNMWGVNVACYLVSLFAVLLIPLPTFGVSSNALSHLNMGGDFIDQPHKMIAWGFLYFSLIGLYELKMRRGNLEKVMV
ncbi:MAG: hypothetical protein WDA22_13830 [Bacteroidota bacterium]